VIVLSDVLVRVESGFDHPAIERVHKAAFGGDAESRLVCAIRAAPGFDADLSLVAALDGEVVGHVLLSPCAIEGDDGVRHEALALAPVGVLPAHQRRGIGRALCRAVLDAARAKGHGIVIVLGHANYYAALGFERARTHGVHPPFYVPDEVFRVMSLDGRVIPAGSVRYPPPFAGV